MHADSVNENRSSDPTGKDAQQAQLAALFEQHRDRLLRMIKLRLDRRLQHRVDSADVLQETWLAAQRKFAMYLEQDKLPFYLWIRLEAGQVLVDLHRFHLGAKMRDAGQEISLHRGALPSVASITLAEQLLGRLSTASHAAMRAELKVKVQDAVNSMDSHDREILALRHFEELSNSEAAMLLGLSPSAACNRHLRALERLRRVFEEMPGGVEGIWL